MHRALISLVIRLTPQLNPNILHALIFRAREVRVICYYNRVDTALRIIIAYRDTSSDLRRTRTSVVRFRTLSIVKFNYTGIRNCEFLFKRYLHLHSSSGKAR